MQFRDADEDDNENDEDDDEEEEENVNDEEWEEENDQCVSLFDSSKSFPSVEEAMKHDAQVHGLDVDAFSALSVYDRIKVVNWCRSSKIANFADHKKEWDNEAFLKPVLQDDPYLTWSPDFVGGEEVVEGELEEGLKRELEEMQEALAKQGLTIEELQK